MKIRFSLAILCLLFMHYAGAQKKPNTQTMQSKPAPTQTITPQQAAAKQNSLQTPPAGRSAKSGTTALGNGNGIKPEVVRNMAQTFPSDPFKVRIYTLPNGLKVYISVDKDAPRIQTMIAVKAGSKFDPPQTTGLAHYLEHMMFKGSHDFGTKNWAKESVLLDSISAYFEYHKNEQNEEKKKALYAKIDSFSYEASKYAIPNEYDKMMTSLGAKGTNAFTSTDMTVFVNDIPSNGLNKFLMLEGDRFQTCVLRLFHTELETVYEEFNRNQDNDRVWSEHAIEKALLPNHPYGTQTTIGRGEDLKNPSMVNIYNYFNTYYRPDNVAIILSGDVDPDKALELINKYFGNWKPAPIPVFVKKPEPDITKPIITEYTGPQPEHVIVGYRFDGANSHDAMMVKLVDMILANGQAGLIDLDLVQQQKVLTAYSYVDDNTDYTFHKFYGEPKQGQTLEQVKDLLVGEVDKVKKGDFGDWLLPAIIQNLKLQRMKEAEKNDSRAYNIMASFVHNMPWKDWVSELDEMAKVSKADIVKFANEHYKDNYAVCYKRVGEADVHKVDKPKITALKMDKESESAFKEAWDKIPEPPVTPKFIDFNKDITHLAIAGGKVPFDYVKNDVNKTFTLQYIFDMGTDNIRELGLAVEYLQYLGTDKYTAEQLKTEFYKLGLDFSVNTGRDQVYVSLSGLEENLEQGVKLFEHVLANAKVDKDVYQSMVMDMLQQRENAKKKKGNIIFAGLPSYAKYGPKNPFNNVLSKQELDGMDPQHLVDLIKSLSSYKHKVFYYGSIDAQQAMGVINGQHKVNGALKDYPAKTPYPEIPIDQTKVYLSYYPMKQVEIIMLGKDVQFDKNLFPYLYLYNEYYGAGLSSIMFQEIREKMALAYSVYSNFGVPQYADESHYLTSYVGSQADKMKTSLAEMDKLLNNMPEVPQQFEDARQNVIKSIASDWLTGTDIYAAYERALKRGLNYDVRKDIYEKAQTLTLTDIHKFFDQHIKGKKFAYLVIGQQGALDEDALKAIGPVEQLSMEQIFGY
ncbi:MAG TPA: insulinase family protein [Chitinophagales bacterium]|nr:insulinase family protein [Chitinophagales bacterium]